MQYHPADQQRMLDAALAKTRRLRASGGSFSLQRPSRHEFPRRSAARSRWASYPETEARRVLEGKQPFPAQPVRVPRDLPTIVTGFDAIVGNPPYRWRPLKSPVIFGKPISPVIWSSTLRNRQRGNADYVAYFFLRAFESIEARWERWGFSCNQHNRAGDANAAFWSGLARLERNNAGIFERSPVVLGLARPSLKIAHVFVRKRHPGQGHCCLGRPKSAESRLRRG